MVWLVFDPSVRRFCGLILVVMQILFYVLTREELKGRRPLAKFLCIKLIVMYVFLPLILTCIGGLHCQSYRVTFYQSFVVRLGSDSPWILARLIGLRRECSSPPYKTTKSSRVRFQLLVVAMVKN